MGTNCKYEEVHFKYSRFTKPQNNKTAIINGPSEMFGPSETPEIKASGLKREYDKYEPIVW